MPRFGSQIIFDPSIRGNLFAKLFVKIFGGVETSSSHLHFIRTLKVLIKGNNITHALDAGCGKGNFSFWLAQKYPKIKIDACDLSEKKIEISKYIQSQLKIANINFFIGNLINYREKDNYDFIFSNHVLEHIVENNKVLSNLVSSLKNGGYIYIQMPNASQKRLPFSNKILRKYVEWEKKEHVEQTLTLDILASTLEDLGCEILIAKHTEGFWGELRFELKELALKYFQSRVLFSFMYPFLLVLGQIDSLINYSSGNGILVIGKKIIR